MFHVSQMQSFCILGQVCHTKRCFSPSVLCSEMSFIIARVFLWVSICTTTLMAIVSAANTVTVPSRNLTSSMQESSVELLFSTPHSSPALVWAHLFTSPLCILSWSTRETSALMHWLHCQGVTVMPSMLDTDALGCSAMSFTGRSVGQVHDEPVPRKL